MLRGLHELFYWTGVVVWVAWALLLGTLVTSFIAGVWRAHVERWAREGRNLGLQGGIPETSGLCVPDPRVIPSPPRPLQREVKDWNLAAVAGRRRQAVEAARRRIRMEGA